MTGDPSNPASRTVGRINRRLRAGGHADAVAAPRRPAAVGERAGLQASAAASAGSGECFGAAEAINPGEVLPTLAFRDAFLCTCVTTGFSATTTAGAAGGAGGGTEGGATGKTGAGFGAGSGLAGTGTGGGDKSGGALTGFLSSRGVTDGRTAGEAGAGFRTSAGFDGAGTGGGGECGGAMGGVLSVRGFFASSPPSVFASS